MSRIALPLKDFGSAVINWGSLIVLLMASQIAQKFTASRLGVIFAFAEPIILINLMIFMRVTVRNQLPLYGDSTAVFVSSGILPFYIYLRVSLRTRGVRYNAAARIPGASSTDYAIASAMAEILVMLTITILWFAAMWAYGLDSAEPASLADCMEPLVFLMVLGFGVGLVNSAISQRFSLWTYIYSYLTYGLMFTSGVFFVVDMMPLHIREVITWNPILHGVEWFRLGLYGQYLVHTLDRGYLVAFALAALFFGFVAHRATLRME